MGLLKAKKLKELRILLGDLKDFLKKEGVEVFQDAKKGTQGKENGYTRCPKCKKRSCIIHENQEIAHCVNCNTTVDHITFYQKKNSLSFREAVFQLCKKSEIEYKSMF